MNNSPIVNAQWLFENRDNPELIILDASLENPVKDKPNHENKVIKNALKFDWAQFSDQNSELPHMMPGESQFTAAAQELGINNNSLLVVYDTIGVYSSPRAWWMFLAMGFANCYVLDGGLPSWLDLNYSYRDTHSLPINKGDFKANYQSRFFVGLGDMLNAINDEDKIIIDARSAERFYGRVEESRTGLRRGHIRNSTNIPFETLLLWTNIGSIEQLERAFEHVGNKDSHLIFSCGSGVTACINALAATLLGYQNISVYDGSWAEWGMNPSCPIAQAPQWT